MIPTYNPDPEYLKVALEGVLRQVGASDEFQIQIVDDCSTTSTSSTIGESLSGSDVVFSRGQKNQGLAGTWNRCIEEAKGEWVHILHQDDLVLPGFYAQLKAAILQSPDAGLAFTRFVFMDEDGHWTALSAIESKNSGVLQNAALRLAASQRIQCASVVVRRAVYTQLGGFRTDLCYALDWEMWARIAAAYPVLYVPEILAGYRVHKLAETQRINSSGGRLADVAKCLDINFGRLDKSLIQHAAGARMQNALDGPLFARQHLISGEYSRALQLFRDSINCCSSAKVLFAWLQLFVWAGLMGISQPIRRLARKLPGNR